MTSPPTDPTDRYADLVAAFRSEAGVTSDFDDPRGRRRFGASTLKVHGKIFAMLVNDRLVVKLPRERVDALVAAGDGERFGPRPGRVMKEWVNLDPASAIEWPPLAGEAMAFVAGKR
ncbi:MAG: TfoX/Sxy family protein [Chloroflexota bacterium]|nr:TfoX/Sxy family protein [Chloroflexota bacterium]